MYEQYCKNKNINGLEIAVIGIGCRFPEAKNYQELWDLLAKGKELVRHFTEEELISSGISREIFSQPSFVKTKATIHGTDKFDASFFNYKDKEAELIEPQERLFYETVWEALEDAGCVPNQYSGAIGLFAGAFFNLYWPLQNILKNGDKARLDLNQFDDKDFIASRVSYRLNLRGPSVAIQTACSTSLVAIHLACRSLLTGECQVAIAGGASVKLPVKFGHTFQEGGVYSRFGHLRSFDENADGIVEGDGVGVVVLKKLEDAVNEGNTIHAIIKGSAINNDGKSKVGYFSPSINGQMEAIRQCYEFAEIDAKSVRFVECHGTGTPLGDQIEIAALKQVFGSNHKYKCALGSAKNNFGHTASAAGVLSFIKSVLSIKYRQFPPHINFLRPHPKLELEKTPFFISSETISFQDIDFPLRGSVSSFGIGGTNAHVVLEEAEAFQTVRSEELKPQFLVFSAQSELALSKTLENFHSYLSRNNCDHLDDIAYTLQTGRDEFDFRAAYVVESKESISTAIATKRCVIQSPQVVFMFPGQGLLYSRMGKNLYEQERLFREPFDYCRKVLLETGFHDIFQLLYSSHQENIHDIDISPILTFCFEYSLARYLQGIGIQPNAFIGHSVGECVAACLSEVFSLKEALKLVVTRGQLMKDLPEGLMISVPLPTHEVEKILPNRCDIAAIHGDSCIVAGSKLDIENFKSALAKQKIITQTLNIKRAGHSSMMDKILEEYTNCLNSIDFKVPKTPFISNVTGTWIDTDAAISPQYWSQQLRAAVQFDRGLETILSMGKSILLEVGPGNSLSMLAHNKKPDKSKTEIIYTVRPQQQANSDRLFLYKQIAKYWVSGGKLDWLSLYSASSRRKIPLPTYPFEHKSYSDSVSSVFEINQTGLLMQDIRKPLPYWFYQPTWQLSTVSSDYDITSHQETFLIFEDEFGVLSRLSETLKEAGNAVYTVKLASEFEANGTEFSINPLQEEGYQKLIDYLEARDSKISKVIHGWQLFSSKKVVKESNQLTAAKYLGFYSIVNFVKAYSQVCHDDSVIIAALSTGLSEIREQTLSSPEKALVLGAIKAIPFEYPNFKCKAINFSFERENNTISEEIIPIVISELYSQDKDQVICYHQKERYIEEFVPLCLSSQKPKPLRLRENGTYVITGGLGGIGLTLAEYISQEKKANLILFSRSAFLEPQDWNTYLKENPESALSQKVQILTKIRKNVVNLEILSADVSDLSQMEKVFQDIRRKYGKVDGVIHCAGVFDGNMIFENTLEHSEQIFISKVDGTIVLDKVIQDEPDFFILCSSLSSYLGNVGQLNYCAASIYLDYYAKFKNSKSNFLTLSINWDAWKEVGGAVQTILEMSEKMQGNQSPKIFLNHPLIKSCISQTPNQVVFQGFIEPTCWIVDQHRVLGKPTFPGVAFIELVIAAFKAFADGNVIEISDMYLLQPFQILEQMEFRIIFLPLGSGYEFSLISSVPDKDSWIEHAKGIISNKTQNIQTGNQHSIKALEAQVNQNQTSEFCDRLNENELTQFGEQWKSCVKKYSRGKDTALIELQLEKTFIKSLEDYKLHPALFDHCMSILEDGEAFAPFMYENVRVYNDFRPHIYGNISKKTLNKSESKMITYDVNILDKNGKAILEVEGYSLLKFENSGKSSEALPSPVEGKAFSTYAPQFDLSTPQSKSEFAASVLSDGISCEEGKEVFAHLLNKCYSNIIVSTKDFKKRLEDNLKDLSQDNFPEKDDQPLSQRPMITVEYVEPKHQNEVQISKVWQGILGIDKVGIHDNFFELGANSLQIIQAATKMKKLLGINVPIISLYTYPTIEELIQHLFPSSNNDPDEGKSLQSNRKRLLDRRKQVLTIEEK